MYTKLAKKVEGEVVGRSNEIIKLIDDDVLKHSKDVVNHIFFLRMKGDHSRYLGELAKGTTSRRGIQRRSRHMSNPGTWPRATSQRHPLSGWAVA